MADEADKVTSEEQKPTAAETTEAPADKKPAGKKPADAKAADKKPAGKKAAGKKPADKKPADAKVADEKPDDEKPDDKKPADEKPVVSERVAPAVPEGKHYFWGTGRRKKAVARVRIRPGTGKITLNKRDMETYFVRDEDRSAVLAPLQCVHMVKSWDIWANIGGGGFTGQAGAVKLGLARALCTAVPDAEHSLRAQGLLTRDARMVERKKPGQKGARKKFQFSKR